MFYVFISNTCFIPLVLASLLLEDQILQFIICKNDFSRAVYFYFLKIKDRIRLPTSTLWRLSRFWKSVNIKQLTGDPMCFCTRTKIYHFIVWIYLSTASSNENVLREQKVKIYAIIVVLMQQIL